MEPRYIEVLGESHYVESVRLYCVTVDVSVTLRVEEAANIRQQFDALDSRFSEAILPIREIFSSVEDGGAEVGSHHDRRNNPCRRWSRRYLFKVGSAGDRNLLIETVSSIPGDPAEAVEATMSQPLFEALPEEAARAHKEAVEEARVKAAAVAVASGGRVGEVLSARQLALSMRSSGAYGDSDWWGDIDRFVPLRHIGGRGSLNADEPSRLIFVRFLVRFELLPGGEG